MLKERDKNMSESYNELIPDQISDLRKIRIEDIKNHPKEEAKKHFEKIDEHCGNLGKLVVERNYNDLTLAALNVFLAGVYNSKKYLNDPMIDLSKFEAEKENVFSTEETLKKYVEENEKDGNVLERIGDLIKNIKVEVVHMILDLEKDLEFMEKELLRWEEGL